MYYYFTFPFSFYNTIQSSFIKKNSDKNAARVQETVNIKTINKTSKIWITSEKSEG